MMNGTLHVHRFRIGAITVELRQGSNTKLLILRNDRSDLPHLLISFGNLSKEVDIHLKRRITGGEEQLTTVAKVSEVAITTALQEFEPRFKEIALQHLGNIRPVRPGWLGRKGYVVSYLTADSEQKLVDMLAPKRKYHSKWERVLRSAGLDDFVQSDLPGQMIFLPSVLHELRSIQYSRPVMVHRIRGGHRPAMTALRLGPDRYGRLKWFPMHKALNDLRTFGESVVEQIKQLLPQDKWNLIRDELHLQEVDWISQSNDRNGKEDY